MNARATLAAVLGLVLAAGACERTRDRPGGEAAAPDAATPVPTPPVDPTRFLVLHQGELEALLRRYPDDCDAAQSDLLRFIGQNRAAFLAAGPAAADPLAGATDPDLLVRSWMEYADRCPVQVARVNQALRAMGP